MKGNNGKAARQRLQKRLLLLIAILAVLVSILSLILSVMVVVETDESVSSSSAIKDGEQQQPRHLFSFNNKNNNNNNNNNNARRQHKTLSSSSWLFGGGGSGGADASAGTMRLLTTDSIDDDDNQDWQDLLQAKVHLVDLIVDDHEVHMTTTTTTTDAADIADVTYGGVYGIYCRLNWAAHKEDPSLVPMFRDLVQQSPACSSTSGHRIKVDLAMAVDKMRQYDTQQQQQQQQHAGDDNNDNEEARVKILDLTGVVFHESRCGSTLVANMLAAMNPDEHRVYSESAPPITALNHVCGETYQKCSLATAAAVLRDVVYTMSRSDNPTEQRVFFKIQSTGSRNLPVFTTAFPDTPWIFVYRDPVEIMMSHLPSNNNNNNNNLRSIRQSNCVRQQLHTPPASVIDILQHHFPGELTRDISPVEYCAAHLASITAQAVASLEEQAAQVVDTENHPYSLGIPVNYRDLPAILWETVLPQYWDMGPIITEAQIHRMQVIAGQYSKGRSGQKKKGTFVEDSAQKQASASPEIRAAANAILRESYLALEDMAAEALSAMN